MKIRNGFVSNSSSSSFVVELHRWDNTDTNYLISEKQIKVLKDNGFKFYNQYYTNLLWFGAKPQEEVKELLNCGDEQLNGTLVSAYLDVLINQWDIIDILIQYKIPFLANIHNDDHLYVWDGKTDYINCFTNYCNMYVHRNMKLTMEYLKTYKPYFKIDLKGQLIENDIDVDHVMMFFEFKQKLKKQINNYFSKNEIEKINNFFKNNHKVILELLKNN